MSEGPIVTHSYPTEGLYTARLRVTAGALSGETTRSVQVGGNIAALTIELQGQGRVISNDERVICTSTCTPSFLSLPLNITLLASPAQGWTLGGWENCDSTSGPACTISTSTSRTVKVRFLPPS